MFRGDPLYSSRNQLCMVCIYTRRSKVYRPESSPILVQTMRKMESKERRTNKGKSV